MQQKNNFVNGFKIKNGVKYNCSVLVYGGTSSAYTTVKENGKTKNADTVVYSKKINGTFYVVEAVPMTKAKTLNIVSAYINKKAVQVSDENNPEETSKTPSAQTSRDSVPQNEGGVKRGEIGKDFNVKADSQSGDLEISLITERFGAEGRAKYASAYENELNSGFNNTEAEFLRSYSRYYLLGLNGKKITDIPSKYADRISQSARKAAYNAGVADRNSSLDAKYKASNEAIVKDGGLIRNHNSENISDEMADVLERLGKMFGVTIEIQDKVIGSDGKEKNGSFLNGEVKLSYDKMMKSGDVERVAELIIDHEISHRVQELAPKEFQKFRDIALDVAIEGDKAKYINDYAKKRNLSYDEAIDEIVCDMVGKESFATKLALEQPNLAERIKNWIKDILDALGIRKYTNGERLLRTWENACNQAQKQVEINRKNPKMQKNNGVEKYSDGNSVKYNYSKTFEEQIDDYLKGNFPKNDTFLVCGTPKILQGVGFNALPVTINQTHVDYALNGTKDADHYLGKPFLKNLPKLLENPVAVIKNSNTNRVTIIVSHKHKGKNAIVPIEIDGYGNLNNIRIDSNAITTTFAKGNILGSLYDSITDEINQNGKSLYYWNKKEALTLLQRAGRQLPRRLPQDGFIHSIREKGTNVNQKFENVTETQQFKRWFGKSKVVNKDGTPKVVYHSTSEKFNIFDITKSRSWDGVPDYDLPGFYFSENYDESAAYGENVGQYYIKITKPYKGDIYTLKQEKGSYRAAH